MLSIKPEHAWPAGIIFLLVFGALTSLSSLYFAASDGGVNVVDDYYQEALKWDEHAALVKDAEKLGWKVAINIATAPLSVSDDNVGLYPTRVNIENNLSVAIKDVSGSIEISRPDKVDWSYKTKLIEDTTAGQYYVNLPLDRDGLWDFVLDLNHHEDRFWTKIRKYDVRITQDI